MKNIYVTLIGLLCITSICFGANSQKDSIAAYKPMRLPENKAKVDSLIQAAYRYKGTVNVEPILAEASRLIDKYSYKEVAFKVLDMYGVELRNHSRYNEALKYHARSLKIAEKDKNIKEQAVANNNIGVVYRRLDENSIALDYHLKALKLAEEIKEYYSVSVSLNSIGNIHIALGNYKDAISYFKRCLPIAEAANNNLGIAMNLNNIGEAYEQMHKIDSAIYYYNASLKYNEKIHCDKGVAICYNSLGNAYQKQQRYKEAVQLYTKALKINSQLGDVIYNAVNYNNLGFVYLHLKRYKEAKSSFRSALSIAKQVGSKMEIKNAYEGLMLLAEQEHNYPDAFTYSKALKLYGDSIVNEKNTHYVREMEAVYEKEKNQQQIKLLEIKEKNTRWLATAGFALFVLLFLSGGLLYVRNRLLKKNELLQRELQLRSEIANDLHDDMGSTLSSVAILSEVAEREIRNGNELLLKDLIDKIQFNTKETQDAVDDIIWSVNPSNDKFQNLSLRIREYAIPLFESKDICFKITTPDTLSQLSLSMDARRNIFLIAKEAVNNLVKYSECTQAVINFSLNHSLLTMRITDNGKGFDIENAKSTRNGLRNMKQRAELIHGNLTITSETGKGTDITLMVKII